MIGQISGLGFPKSFLPAAIALLLFSALKVRADYNPRADVFPGDHGESIQFFHKTFYAFDSLDGFTDKWVGLYGNRMESEYRDIEAVNGYLPRYTRLSQIKTNSLWTCLGLMGAALAVEPFVPKAGRPLLAIPVFASLGFGGSYLTFNYLECNLLLKIKGGVNSIRPNSD
jgi:hypothetical protein